MEKIDAYRTSDGKIFYNEALAIAHQQELDSIKTYMVTLHYTSTFVVNVKASSEEEALQKAREYDNVEELYIDEDEAAAEVEEIK